MKIPLLLILLIVLFSCNSHHLSKTNNGDLNYSQTTAQSSNLSAELNLSANIKGQELLAVLQITNTGSKPISIQQIEISTPDGLRSLPENGNIDSLILDAGKDTVLSVKFTAMNDLKMFRLTGRSGYFKPAYNILISYKESGSNPVSSMSLKAQMPAADYKAYLSKYKASLTSFSFNTKTDFTTKQKRYLETLKQVDQPPFVFVSEQEIAVSGLNFRLKSFCEHDTLNAELFIVNHASFPVKINKDAINFTYPGEPADSLKSVQVEKISGPQQNMDLLEKGDRVLIHFKKYFKDPGKQIQLSFNKAFILNGLVPLFTDDIELVKISLP